MSTSETSRASRTPVMRELSVPADPAARGARLRVDLNAGWRFVRDEQSAHESALAHRNGHPPVFDSAELVNLPHSVRLDPLNASGGRNFQGVCWYARELPVRDEWQGRTVYLHFEGAMHTADVWLNDRKIASHYCGYTPFMIDLSQLLHFSPGARNVLTVRLDNRDHPQVPPGKPQAELDFAYFGGLYRSVRLEVMGRLHITGPVLADRVAGGGLFITYPEVSRDRATVRVRTEVQNEHANARRCSTRQELIDASGAIVATTSFAHTIPADGVYTFDQQIDVSHPRLWHPNHPNLYSLRTTLSDDMNVIDEIVTRIGIRQIRFDRDEGFFINGEKFLSLGANRHQDHPYVGNALPDSAHWRDAKKLREAGFTSVRSHYPQAPAFMDACDEFGLLTIVSNPGWQFVGDDVFRERAIHNARTMVRRDRNRPSVILWEAALNESDNREIGAALQQAVHEEFPGDQCYTSGDHEPAAGWDVEYLHNDGTKPYWIREWGDQVDNWSDQQSRNRVARGWGEMPMLMQANAHLARMNEILIGHHGSSSGENGRRLCGACLWAAIDCHRGYHHQPFYGGPFDLFRLPKFSHYLFQSQLDDRPMVFIANFDSPLSPTTITVFSNCEQVRLLRADKVVAVNKPEAGHRIPHPPFVFQVEPIARERTTMYMNGAGVCPNEVDNACVELKAEGLIDGKVVATHIVRPPGVARKLVLEADLCGRDLVADASDWVRIYAKVCDARGTVCPFADDSIHFSVDGEGSIIGDCLPEIGANPIRAEAGIATALVRSTNIAGRLIVRATTFGLTAGEVEIISRPYASQQAGQSHGQPQAAAQNRAADARTLV